MKGNFHHQLLHYLQRGSLNRSDKLLSFVAPEFVYKKNARIISDIFRKQSGAKDDGMIVEVNIKSYTGKNVVAQKITEVLERKAAHDLAGAYVHGSIGTGEEISYSDFDGLVILKNDAVADPAQLFRLVETLKETERMMHEQDPLQHHGWFVLTENDLEDFPEYYFPHELFKYSGCLMGKNNLQIRLLQSATGNAFSESFHKLVRSINRKLDTKVFLLNYYIFKNLISEFMLLPALFLQAKTGKGVFKKFSFDLVRNEPGIKYDTMNEVSAIRAEWKYKPHEKYMRMLHTHPLFRSWRGLHAHSGAVPEALRKKFDSGMITRMKDFTIALEEALGK